MNKGTVKISIEEYEDLLENKKIVNEFRKNGEAFYVITPFTYTVISVTKDEAVKRLKENFEYSNNRHDALLRKYHELKRKIADTNIFNLRKLKRSICQ